VQWVEYLFWPSIWIMITVALVISAYAATRAGSIAYFRTKLEYMRSVMREGARHNGQ
jgi:hypothetical protein